MHEPDHLDTILLEVKDLRTYFYLDEGLSKAVDGVSFALNRGQILGIVGESGCGKSVTSQSILRIVPSPGKIVSGQILFHRPSRDRTSSETIDLVQLNPRGREIRHIRGGDISMIFQEPMTALSPVHTIGNQIIETIMLHQQVNPKEARKRAIDILARVGMPQPEVTIDSYRDQLSGGMRQRAMIAIALSCNPALLIADEPTTALDVTVEAQILELMRELQKSLGMSIMYISHNLGVIAEMAQDVVVMYLGRVVESAPVRSIFARPLHPYTQALLKSLPRLGHKSEDPLAVITGSVPDPFNIPTGCPFHPRCSSFMPGKCDRENPQLVEVSPQDHHHVSCLLYR